MASITWLHLSDWHEGMESYDKDAIRYDREVVRDALIEDIRHREEISRDLSRIDFIVFSGDVAYSGKAHEYEKARKNFLDKVLNVTGLKPERLFIVPGNHDVDRSIIENEHFFRDLKISEKKFPDLLKGSHNLNVLLKPFEAFKEFVTNYTKLQNLDYASILLKNINTKKLLCWA